MKEVIEPDKYTAQTVNNRRNARSGTTIHNTLNNIP